MLYLQFEKIKKISSLFSRSNPQNRAQFVLIFYSIPTPIFSSFFYVRVRITRWGVTDSEIVQRARAVSKNNKNTFRNVKQLGSCRLYERDFYTK